MTDLSGTDWTELCQWQTQLRYWTGGGREEERTDKLTRTLGCEEESLSLDKSREAKKSRTADNTFEGPLYLRQHRWVCRQATFMKPVFSRGRQAFVTNSKT